VSLDGFGRVRAMVGGVDYAKGPFNRAIDAHRQAGSAWKPFVYLTAMEAGRTPETPVIDEPIKIGNWEPKNYTGQYLGPITIRVALQQSINTVAAQLASEVGTANVAATAKRLGITSAIQLDPSMALGAVEVSPLEMAQAYAPFSNGGVFARGYGIENIRNARGDVVYAHGASGGPRQAVIGQPALAYMVTMMRGVIAGGTGGRAQVSGYDIAGKTGTTSDYRDAWFVGYTGGFVTAVWVGKDDNKPMKRVTGGGPPAAIWRAYMTQALPRLKVQPIPGGDYVPEPTNPITDILEGVAEVFKGDHDTPPPSAFEDRGAVPPRARHREEPQF
jgi:penicillin-binding protein 1A